jgi:hypothetical protein
MTPKQKSLGPDREANKSNYDSSNHCVILGGSDFALQLAIVLRSIGIQVTCVVDSQALPDTVIFGMEGFVWEGRSRIGWNYLPLFPFFSIPLDSKAIRSLIEECRQSEVNYLWTSSPPPGRRSMNLFSPNLEDLRPYDQEAELCFQLISQQFTKWCRAWLSQLSWQSEQAESAREKRAIRLALRQAKQASRQFQNESTGGKGQLDASEQDTSSRSKENSLHGDAVGLRTQSSQGLGDWVRGAALRFKMAGKRWEPATAPTWIRKSLRREFRTLGRSSSLWLKLDRHWRTPLDRSKWTATEWRLENLRIRHRQLIGLEGPLENHPDQAFQISAILERLKGLPDVGRVSTYWLPDQTSLNRQRKLRDYAEEAGVVFLKIKGHDKLPVIESMRLHREEGAMKKISVLIAENQELHLDSAAVVLVDPQLKSKLKEEAWLEKQLIGRPIKICTLCFQFEAPTPPLGTQRFRIHWNNQELELEWAELSRLGVGIKSGFVLWVRFALPDSWDGKSESCRLIALDVFEFLLKTFPGQFLGVTRFFPDARSSLQWEADSNLIGGTSVRDEWDGVAANLGGPSSFGEGLFVMTPEANYGLGRWGGFIKMVELGVWWSHRLAIPWHIKGTALSSVAEGQKSNS